MMQWRFEGGVRRWSKARVTECGSVGLFRPLLTAMGRGASVKKGTATLWDCMANDEYTRYGRPSLFPFLVRLELTSTWSFVLTFWPHILRSPTTTTTPGH